jgi:hypothetical protein
MAEPKPANLSSSRSVNRFAQICRKAAVSISKGALGRLFLFRSVSRVQLLMN